MKEKKIFECKDLLKLNIGDIVDLGRDEKVIIFKKKIEQNFTHFYHFPEIFVYGKGFFSVSRNHQNNLDYAPWKIWTTE